MAEPALVSEFFSAQVLQEPSVHSHPAHHGTSGGIRLGAACCCCCGGGRRGRWCAVFAFEAACPSTRCHQSLPRSHAPCSPSLAGKGGRVERGEKHRAQAHQSEAFRIGGRGGMEISESNVTSRCKSCVQRAKPPSAGRSTMQLIDGSRFCCRWRLSTTTTTTTTTPSHSQSKSPLSQGRETGEAHRRNKSPLPPLPAVGSPAARLASFQEFAVRLLHHLPPPLPHLLPMAAAVSSMFLGPSACVPSCPFTLPAGLARNEGAIPRWCVSAGAFRQARTETRLYMWDQGALVVMMGSKLDTQFYLQWCVCKRHGQCVR